MKGHALILKILTIVCILPFLWCLFNMLTGFEYSDLKYGGVFIFWGTIGFFLSFCSVYFLRKINRINNESAKIGLTFIFNIYQVIAIILLIFGFIFLIIILLISTGPEFRF